jgi:1,4-dihydroxy-2-naphthoate octaprenyltransferase
MAGMNRWLIGARPRTLPAAVVPVALGAAAAAGEPGPVWWRVAPALLVSLALQVGVNYANDYSDGVRGTDAVRVGPVRLVAGGLASPRAVKRAALLAFGVAAVVGLLLAAVTSWWLLAVGAAALLAGWGYTGGPKPYGYLGLGELMVLVFFGFVATAGSAFVQLERVPSAAWWGSLTVGLMACAILMANNVRDVATDTVSGKRTLAVRLGEHRARRLYVAALVVAFLAIIPIAFEFPWALLAFLAVPLAIPPARLVLRATAPPQLVAALIATGRLELVTALLLTVGLCLR